MRRIQVQPVRRSAEISAAIRQRAQRRWLACAAGAAGRALPEPDEAAPFPRRRAFASPDVCELLEAEGYNYTIQLGMHHSPKKFAFDIAIENAAMRAWPDRPHGAGVTDSASRPLKLRGLASRAGAGA